MKRSRIKVSWLLLIMGFIVPGLMVTNVPAAEIMVEQVPVQRTRIVQEVIKTADNFIVLFDASGSMQDEYMKTGKKKIDLAYTMFKERAARVPELDWNAGMYVYTPWKSFYEMQPFNKDAFGKAVDEMAAYRPSMSYKIQPSPLGNGIRNLDPILAKLSGKTAVFLFTDGQFTFSGPKIWPVPAAQKIASKYDADFIVISSAQTKKSRKLVEGIAAVNEGSRVVTFDDLLKRPEYMTGAIYVLQDRALVETELVSKVVGIDLNYILFDFDKTDIRPEYQDELDTLGKFMQMHPKAYVVIEGFADRTGDVAYNMYLSRARAESVRDYLQQNFNLDEDRLVVVWYGKAVPVASDDTAEGRQKNRRVRLSIRGME